MVTMLSLLCNPRSSINANAFPLGIWSMTVPSLIANTLYARIETRVNWLIFLTPGRGALGAHRAHFWPAENNTHKECHQRMERFHWRGAEGEEYACSALLFLKA